ncbi:recombinase family protein [Streptomyces achromogenes]|uniref:recombinase family protein n=1 Tax=Streptomyces achromogenes TaxID=67255 RepID=UPI003687F0F0
MGDPGGAATPRGLASRERTDVRKSTLPSQRRKKFRVAIYLRVSTAQQLEGYGLEDQLVICLAQLDRVLGVGTYEYEVFTDGAVSGKLSSRPDLNEMNVQLRAGDFNVATFGKLDRIGRTMRDIHRWVYDVTDLGVRVLTGDGRLDSEDDMFGIMMSLLAFMAELEHTLILERTMGGRERKLAEGGWPAGVPAFGLALQGKGKDAVVVLHEDEVHCILKAVDLFADETGWTGLTKEEVGAELNAAGYRRRSGKPWDSGSVDRLLRGTHLLEGKIYYRRTDGRTGTKVDENGVPLYGPTVALEVPRILSKERAAQLQKALDDSAHDRIPNRQYPLSGRIVSSCGKRYTGAGRAEVRKYRCQAAVGDDACGDSYLDAAAVEKDVWARLERFLEDPDRLRALAEEWSASLPGNHTAYTERAETLRKQVDAQQKAVKNAIKNAAVLGLDEEATREAVDEMNVELETLRSALAETEAWLAEYDSAQVLAASMVDLVEKAKGKLHMLDLAKQAELFDMFDITVMPEEHKFSRRNGRPCTVTAWHVETGTLVPDDPDDTAWRQVQDVLLDIDPELLKGRFDVRQALRAMLHRLRTGTTWQELNGVFGVSTPTLKRLQGLWVKSGAWELMMPVLLAQGGGTEVFQAPVIPPLKVYGKITDDLFTNLLPGGGPSRRW